MQVAIKERVRSSIVPNPRFMSFAAHIAANNFERPFSGLSISRQSQDKSLACSAQIAFGILFRVVFFLLLLLLLLLFQPVNEVVEAGLLEEEDGRKQ